MFVPVFAALLVAVNGHCLYDTSLDNDQHGLLRMRRQVKTPIVGGEKNTLSQIADATYDHNKQLTSATAGLALDNVNGHGAALTYSNIPSFGDKLTAAGKLNLAHNDNHDLSANAFITRNMPRTHQLPNYNTVGGGLDYMYKDKVGASLSASHTPLFERTDYSATGNLNLFKGKDSSLDFKAGFNKFDTPFMRSSWEPSGAFIYRKFF